MKENCTLFTEVLTEINLLYGYLLPGIPIRYLLPGIPIRYPLAGTPIRYPHRGIQRWLCRYPNYCDVLPSHFLS